MDNTNWLLPFLKSKEELEKEARDAITEECIGCEYAVDNKCQQGFILYRDAFNKPPFVCKKKRRYRKVTLSERDGTPVDANNPEFADRYVGCETRIESTDNPDDPTHEWYIETEAWYLK